MLLRISKSSTRYTVEVMQATPLGLQYYLEVLEDITYVASTILTGSNCVVRQSDLALVVESPFQREYLSRLAAYVEDLLRSRQFRPCVGSTPFTGSTQVDWHIPPVTLEIKEAVDDARTTQPKNG